MQKAVSTRPREIWLLISHRTAPGRPFTLDALIHTLTAQIGVATFEASFALDLLGWLFGLKPLTTAGYWSLLVAAASLTIAAFAGTITRRRWQKETGINQVSSDTAEAVRRHAYLGVFFYTLIVGVLAWRMELAWVVSAGFRRQEPVQASWCGPGPRRRQRAFHRDGRVRQQQSAHRQGDR